jgi:preprotein translocase subunit SecG
MSFLISVSTVIFLVLCILLIIIILLQSDKSAGMGILGGSSQSAFGSSTADVITKISAVMITLFMLGSLGLAILESNRSESLEKKVLQTEESGSGMIQESKEKPADAPMEKQKTDPVKEPVK